MWIRQEGSVAGHLDTVWLPSSVFEEILRLLWSAKLLQRHIVHIAGDTVSAKQALVNSSSSRTKHGTKCAYPGRKKKPDLTPKNKKGFLNVKIQFSCQQLVAKARPFALLIVPPAFRIPTNSTLKTPLTPPPPFPFITYSKLQATVM
jgi:hypothetical protein